MMFWDHTDVRYSLRSLRKDATFTLVVAFTLTMGIGGSTALFTVVHQVLLRPLAIPDSDRVLLVYNSYPKAGIEHVGTAASDYADRLEGVTAFDEQALLDFRNPSLDTGVAGGAAPERVHAMRTTASLFRLVRVRPQAGRTFTGEEDEPGQANVVVLAAGLAQQLFGGGDALGRTVRIDGVPHAVVGVMPAGFSFIDSNVQVWLPLRLTSQERQAHNHRNIYIYVARLKRGATPEQAQAQIDAVNAANLDRFPDTRQVTLDTGFRSVAVRLQDDLVRNLRPTLRLLWAGALFVLLIGSVNVASLVLARSRARFKEFATREALGASRWRLLRQLVIEHLMLTLSSSAAGIFVAYAALRAIGTLRIEHLPPGAEIRIDATVVAYTVALAAMIGTALGACPLLGGLPSDPVIVLRDETRTGTSRGGKTFGRALVVMQISIAFVLLDGAGLLLASFERVAAVDPGFAMDGTLTASINLPSARYADDAALRRITDEVLGAVRSLPGVVAAGATSAIPFGNERGMGLLLAEGYRPRQNEPLLGSYRVAVTPGYFEAMRVALVRGRFFDERDNADRAGAPKTIVVDTVLAHRYWPDVDPIGRRAFFPTNVKDPYAVSDSTVRFTVVGVVNELKLHGLVEGVGAMGAFYVPYAQAPERSLTLALHTTAEPLSLSTALRRVVGQIDRELPVSDVQTMASRAQQSLMSRRTPMLLAIGFGAAALVVSAIGVYGVLAHLVAQRRKEIGIRIALGSTTRGVFALVLNEGLLLIACGFVLGASGALMLARSLQSQLFEVRPTDPIVFSLAIVILALVAIAACLVPARRATRIDPVIVLAE
jgi:predicted permease